MVAVFIDSSSPAIRHPIRTCPSAVPTIALKASV